MTRTSPTHQKSLGNWGEATAAAYLGQNGYTILGQNVRTPHGEIDLIARQSESGVVVFVEVKTRSNTKFGLPETAITARKRAHLQANAAWYMQQHPDLAAEWRIDVIAIERGGPPRPPLITHFENALQD